MMLHDLKLVLYNERLAQLNMPSFKLRRSQHFDVVSLYASTLERPSRA